MLIACANPWICLGLALFWLVLTFLAPTQSMVLPTLSQIVASSLFLYALLLSATLLTAASVPVAEKERHANLAVRAWQVLHADVLAPLRRGPVWRVLATGMEVGVALVFFSLIVSLLVGLLTEAMGREVELQTVVNVFLQSSWPGRIALVTMVVLFTPVVEELFFRYALETVLAGALRSRMKALSYGAIIFASMHGNLAAFPSLLFVSVGCSLAYRHAGNLLAPIVAHFIFNLVSVMLLLVGVAN